ncbi:hypothetical protein MLGJGCBP_03098 [Rhodococcus sp. T7]|nr:hypothetical protein MLGJGCBP_03098 [Rhodococcus sp. T7]
MNHRRREVDAVLGEQCRVDLAELDAEATDLDLGVGPADELERVVACLGSLRRPHPAHLVTGAVEPRPRLTEGVGHESVRRQPVPMVIATCDSGAGEVELTHHPHGHGTELAVEHHDARPLDRPADGNRIARRQRLTCGDDDGRLGRPVTVGEAAHLPEALHQVGGAHVPAHHHRLEMFEPTRVDCVHHRRSRDDVGHALFAQQVDEVGSTVHLGRGDNHRGTGAERLDHLEYRGIETGRREPQHPRFVVNAEFRAGAGREVRQTAVGDDDPFRKPCRSRCVDHVRGVVDRQRGATIHVADRGAPLPVAPGAHLVVVEDEPVNAVGQCCTQFVQCEPHQCPRIGQHVRDSLGWQLRIDRHESGPGLGDRPERDE